MNTTMHTFTLDTREHATVLAALRFWQRMPSEASEPENDIATSMDEHAALSLAEIDALCLRLNTADSPAETPAAPAITHRCPDCGSDQVFAEATLTWCETAQKWQIGYDVQISCHDCGKDDKFGDDFEVPL